MTVLNRRKYAADPREFPGACSVTEITISGVDVSDNWQQIDVFESAWSVMSARITMVDTENLIKTIPMRGEEKVRIVLDDGKDVHEHDFRLYRISDRVNATHGALSYVIHLCTEETWRDAFTKVSRSFHDSPLENSARSVIESSWGLGSSKEIIMGDTESPASVVIPNWSPVRAVSWMAGRAVPAELRYHADFTFFETASGLRWVSLDNLVDPVANTPYGEITHDPMRPSADGMTRFDPRNPDDVMRLENWKVEKSFDTLQNARAGMYASRTRVLDVGTRGAVDSVHDYVASFHDGQHLSGVGGINPTPLCSVSADFVGAYSAREDVVVRHEGLYDTEELGNTSPERWLISKISRRQQLSNFSIAGSMPGHLGMEAGMIVNFRFPNPEKMSVDPSTGYDPEHSGQYLITGLRRMVKRDKFDLVLEMTKDSRGQDPNVLIAP